MGHQIEHVLTGTVRQRGSKGSAEEKVMRQKGRHLPVKERDFGLTGCSHADSSWFYSILDCLLALVAKFGATVHICSDESPSSGCFPR